MDIYHFKLSLLDEIAYNVDKKCLLCVNVGICSEVLDEVGVLLLAFIDDNDISWILYQH